MPCTAKKHFYITSDLTPGQAKRLYGPIIILDILNEELIDPQSADSNSEQVTRSDSIEVFPCFVNKLAQICDIKHGGDNVTAVAVLQPGGIEYRLTSNNRTSTAFEKVKSFLTNDILGALGATSDQVLRDSTQVEGLRSTILLKVLAFNRWRIKYYVRSLVGNVDFCIDSCTREGTPDANSVSQDLRAIRHVAEKAGQEWPDPVSFARHSYDLLQVIAARYSSSEGFLRLKTRSDRERTTPTSWSHVRHAIGRLHSYSIAAMVFVEARIRWPELFVEFEVTHVPSAPRGGNPVQMKENRCGGHGILRSLNARSEVLDAYGAFNSQLGGLIDGRLVAQIKAPNDKFYTVVHAEVGLADNIHREHYRNVDAEGPVRFFNEGIFGRYIGSSKPTCLLCNLFFEVHPMRFRHRHSHHNLYVKWRVPEGTPRDIVEGLAKKLKTLVFQTITERAGRVQSRFDSGHTPTDPWNTSVGARHYIAAQAAGAGLGLVSGKGGYRDLGDAGEESFESGEYDEGVEELEDLMGRLDHVQTYSCGSGDRRGSCHASDGEDSDDGGAKL